jgi:hypothetical protein
MSAPFSSFLLDLPTAVDKYFNIVEHIAVRSSLLLLLLLELYRLVRRKWRRR